MSIESLKLYHFPASRSARVKWMLHEVVDSRFAIEIVDVYAGALFSPRFLRMNPNHSVPILEIFWSDGSAQQMLESTAIVAFLADAYGEAHLAPPVQASRGRADYLQMLQFGGTTMDMLLWQIRIHEHMLEIQERDPRTVTRYRTKFATEIEPQLCQRLESAPYICGEAFTAADCIMGHNVLWARRYGLCRASVFRRYLARLAKRPACKAAFDDIDAFILEVAPEQPLLTTFNG
ncbi:glutathione S-transferase family protein [Vulcanococcus limneticus]|uniref:glutathione S-transferase family protein n=1 Tax=Vulcanococcus limneticus TaxID=2170428 RepID=UPI00398BC1DA